MLASQLKAADRFVNHVATVDEHLQKVGAEAFNKFERYVYR